MPRLVKKFLGLFGKQTKSFQQEFTGQLLNLVTSGFGLVAALAWNEVIKEAVDMFIRPFAGRFSGIISLVIYALVVTILAVLVTYNLTKFSKRG